MKILFFGDSITDAGRNREMGSHMSTLGWGFVRCIADRLQGGALDKYEIVNRGISGNRIVDLYARIKEDVWNEQPDVVSILIGVNDIWHEISRRSGVDIVRFEKVYRMLLEDMKTYLPNAKIILCEPFVLEGTATQNTQEIPDKYEMFCQVYAYAKVVKKLAREFALSFLPLQEKFTLGAQKTQASDYLYDGVHPHIAGATLIADEWVKLFKQEVMDNK